MKTGLTFRLFFIGAAIAILLSGIALPQGNTLSGRVYDGADGTETKPIQGVTVKLYGAQNQGDLGTEINSTTTDQNGWYGLRAPEGYEFYNIKEVNPGGYNSVSARSVSGTVINSDRIQYSVASEPLASQTLTGNKFWDKKPSTNNPPVADAGGPYYTKPGMPTKLDGSGSYDPDGDSIVKYEWFWLKQGTYHPIGGGSSSPILTWVPPTAGKFTIKLQVTDEHGEIGTDTAPITIKEETTIEEDYGDAPASYYATGGFHLSISSDFLLGNKIDGESSVQPSSDALGDDQNGQDDEDGVQFITPLVPGAEAQVTLDLTGVDPSKYTEWGVYGYLDYDQSGTWENHERVVYLTMADLTAGSIDTVSFLVPASSKTGTTYAHFYLIFLGPVPAHGNPWGEVEDYQVIITDTEGYDYGDAPAQYPPAWHDLGGPWLGSIAPDAEAGTQADVMALGDDKNGIDDEDGLTVTNGYVVKGKNYLLNWSSSYTGTGSWWTALWIDWDNDGIWGTSLGGGGASGTGWLSISFSSIVPNTTPAGFVNVRIRAFKYNQSLPDTPDGYGGPGEVEDFAIEVREEGDAPPEGGVIFGVKWYDKNGNGGWTKGEPTLAGWTIWLDANQNGVEDAGDRYTTTNLKGQYMFTGLKDGNYLVGEELPTGWIQTCPGGGGTYTATVQQGQPFTGLNFGNYQRDAGDKGIIQGMKFNDLNGDGIMDPGEPGLPNWTIWLDLNQNGAQDKGDLYTVTGTSGEYSFMNLPAGTYHVYETQKPGWTQTYPTGMPPNPVQPAYHSVVIMGGDVQTDNNFGNTGSDPVGYDFGDAPSGYPDASNIPGNVWLGGPADAPDREAGTQADPMAEGDDNNGDDENGLNFTNGWIPKGGWAQGQLDVWATVEPFGSFSIGLWIDYNIDGDWNDTGETLLNISIHNPTNVQVQCTGPISGIIGKVPAAAVSGNTFARIRIENGSKSLSPDGPGDVGEVEDHMVEIREGGTPAPPGCIITGLKWNDLNGDGVPQAGEPKLQNWTIWLDINGNGTFDAMDQETQTDASGQFLFTGLADGNYTVHEELPPGWIQTCPGGSGTYTVTVQLGQPVQLLIFGNMESGFDSGLGGPRKWSQPPVQDMDSETFLFRGWSEPSVSSAVLLADDWFCHDPRPVTAIRWWGAYAGWDSIAPPLYAPLAFHISIWTDVPGGVDSEYSHPGTLIREWDVDRNQLGEEAYGSFLMREFMEMPDTCFQYTFFIPNADWFYQEGDSTVYWLSIAAIYREFPEEYMWGWLTRERYFNDDAVHVYQPSLAHQDSVFRIGEPMPEGWDMAFELGTDIYCSSLDFGDAPMDRGGTLKITNGACHLLRNDVLLGSLVDLDEDGQPATDATGDDQDGFDDEDGVEFLGEPVPGQLAQVAVTVSAYGYLNAWLDVNGNGEWEHFEWFFREQELTAGTHVLEFPVLDEILPGERIMRFRFSTWPGIKAKGFAPDGEVEDHVVLIKPSTAVEPDRGEPDRYFLHQNYPNPFNPVTTIQYEIANSGPVRLLIYNLIGQQVAELVNEKQTSGRHTVQWDGHDLNGQPVSSGMYIIYLESGTFRKTGKLLLVR